MGVTIRDVAREARVSVASVSRALNGHANVTEQTRSRILGIAASLRYVPHSAARSLITRRTQTIGALLPELYGEFFSELIRGIDLAARGRGLHLLVSSSHGDASEAASALRAMQGRVDGMLILSPHVDANFLRANLPESTPSVLLNSPLQSGPYTVFNVDNFGGARAMVQHLIATGHHDVVLIAGPADNFDAQQRELGYRAAMAESASGARPDVVAGDFTEASGCRAGRALLARTQLPSAVFAANDMMAVGCLQAFAEAGVIVPDTIAVAGFDDIPIARYVEPALTTVHVRIADLGRHALMRLVAAIEMPEGEHTREETLDCQVVVRASCGAQAGKATSRKSQIQRAQIQ